MSGNSVHTSATKAEALTIQSSTQGATIIWLRGQNRIPGNLLWYGDFKATPHTEQTSGGKGGGGGTNTSYTYSASIVLGLCHGVVSAINWVIKSKSKTTLEKLGMSFKSGAVGQPVWSGLAGKGVESLGYSGLACVVAQAYDLGDSTSIENHAFEVTHASAYAISGSVPDVDPAVSTRDLLGHPLQGAAMPASTLGDWTEWSNYCVATGLVMSPYLDAQTDASEALKKIAELTNTAIVWSEGKLKMRPYGDAPATGNGRVFTPNTTPVYELDDTCFLVSDGEVPVKRALKSSTECYNTVSIEYRDRSNDYNTAVVTAKDRTDIAANGIRAKDTITAPWITEGAVARLVAELTKQRALNVLGTYKFRLPMNFALLECMDLVTLTEQQLLLADEPVLIKTITEADDLELEIEAEDYPAGMASAPLYPVQAPQGFSADYLVAPGDTSSVVVFEGPGALTGNQLEIWVAARGDDANWGGCTVWVSLDGTTYRAMGRIEGGSRCGQLTSAITPLPSTSLSQVHVGIGAKQQLINVSEADADALNSLCYVGGATPEFLAYTYATLQSAGNYLLWRLVRGAYGTPSSSAHASGDSFAFIDSSIAKSGLIDDAYVGKTIYIKCTSFNLFGVAEQSLADVDEQAYQITGNYYTSAAELAAQAQAAAIAEATQLIGDVSLSSLGQQSWRVIAAGHTSSAALPAAAGIHHNGQHLYSGIRSYNLVIVSRATGQIVWGPQTYDVYAGGGNTSGRNAETLANDLNATTSEYIVIVWTDDEPQNNRMSGGLPAAMYRCGASAAVFGSPNFRYRSAYILVGIPGCGAGNGAEAYQGAVDSDPNAWCELAFTVANGAISGVSVGHTPTSLQDYGYTGDLNATYGATAADMAAAAADATAKANAAHDAAVAAAAAQAALAETAAKAYADGQVDAEEARAIADATAKANAAQAAAVAAASAAGFTGTTQLATNATFDEGHAWVVGPITTVGDVLSFPVVPSVDCVLKLTLTLDGTITSTSIS